ncbi:MAG: DUF1508 domain-containing protein [Saprospiraceae bacterium]|nr:DUF1508 domain-containing protein [Lewinella sp.]
MKVQVYHRSSDTELIYYYKLEAEGIVLRSGDFPDQMSCLENAHQIWLHLQHGTPEDTPIYLQKRGDNWEVHFPEQLHLLLEQPATCNNAEEEQSIIHQLRTASQDHSFAEDMEEHFPGEENEDNQSIEPPMPTPTSTDPDMPSSMPIHQDIDDHSPDTGSDKNEFGFSTYNASIDNEDRHFFRFNDPSGSPLLTSEAYHHENGRDNGIASLRKHGKDQRRYIRKEEDGRHFFTIEAKNGQEIARSRDFSSRQEVDHTIVQLVNYFGSGSSSRSIGKVIQTAINPCSPIQNPLKLEEPAQFPLFSGRDKELEDIYRMSFETNLLLLFGAQGSGKSSLVRWGLPEQFEHSEWQFIIVEREENINQSLHRHLLRVWGQVAPDGEEMETDDPLQMLQKIHGSQLKSIYLIFDQLERLFSQGGAANAEEKQEFFSFLQQLRGADGAIKAMLVIDEAYLGHLWNYEAIVPKLDEYRYRLEGQGIDYLKNGLDNSLHFLEMQRGVAVVGRQGVAGSITGFLQKQGGRKMALGCMNIYMHQLHRGACQRKGSGLPTITEELINLVGDPFEIVEDYKKEQRILLKKQLLEPDCDREEIEKKLEKLQEACPEPDVPTTPPPPQTAVSPTALSAPAAAPPPSKSSPPVWIFWLGWLGALLTALLLISFGNSGLPATCDKCRDYLAENGTDARFSKTCELLLKTDECLPQACQDALAADDCNVYIKHLYTYGVNEPCSEDIIRRVVEKCLFPGDTTMLKECRLLVETLPGNVPDYFLCSIYQEYLQRFGDESGCAPEIRQQLQRRGCPSPPRDTIRDTVVFRNYDNPVPISKPAIPGIKMGNICYLEVTEAPVNWYDAKKECRKLGDDWELACSSQIDYLIGTFYRGGLKSAYSNLFDAGQRSLDIAPNGYWTATESTDETGYAVLLYNQEVHVLGNNPKSQSRPCLCIKPAENFNKSKIPKACSSQRELN